MKSLHAIATAVLLVTAPVYANAQASYVARETVPSGNIAWALGNQQTGEPGYLNGKAVQVQAINIAGTEAAICLKDPWGANAGIGWLRSDGSVVIPTDGNTGQPFAADVLSFTWYQGGLAYNANGSTWWWKSDNSFIGPQSGITLAESGNTLVGQNQNVATIWQNGRPSPVSLNKGSVALGVTYSRTWDNERTEVVGNDPAGIGPFYFFVSASGIDRNVAPLSATAYVPLASQVQYLPNGVVLTRIVSVGPDMRRIVCTASVPIGYGRTRTALYELVRTY